MEASIVGAAGCDEFIRKPLREEYIVKAMADHIGVQFIYEEATEAPATTAHRSLTADVLAILARRAAHPPHCTKLASGNNRRARRTSRGPIALS
ncbi:MAG: hypothetical protein HOI20_18705 [Gemmatimonadetes bacterium]|nr:hypothetical protein [Gemmatimonadota bacterium]MBT6908189.1 hypothetical protein [Gemmatimonadota bacterium]MBT7587055.1 hypothetical protein [Gemmatimonadota bacterium]